mmetsp:Transcript_36652/g.121415  ORF Transcript_36652/g.121415 Transcript_36652/m.121415 type:complete len:233 (-) Transcript_36652:31-729(-)
MRLRLVEHVEEELEADDSRVVVRPPGAEEGEEPPPGQADVGSTPQREAKDVRSLRAARVEGAVANVEGGVEVGDNLATETRVAGPLGGIASGPRELRRLLHHERIREGRREWRARLAALPLAHPRRRRAPVPIRRPHLAQPGPCLDSHLIDQSCDRAGRLAVRLCVAVHVAHGVRHRRQRRGPGDVGRPAAVPNERHHVGQRARPLLGEDDVPHPPREEGRHLEVERHRLAA